VPRVSLDSPEVDSVSQERGKVGPPETVKGRGVDMIPAPYNILNALQAVRGLLSVDQVAELFGKSSATIYRMAQKRQIPSIMLGGSRMFDPSTLALWLTRKEPLLAVAARQFQKTT
jgi:excisionase family DNA binding protein